eukprot:2237844-Pleurochrysis_carterae.AAC.1
MNSSSLTPFTSWGAQPTYTHGSPLPTLRRGLAPSPNDGAAVARGKLPASAGLDPKTALSTEQRGMVENVETDSTKNVETDSTKSRNGIVR